jgi:ribosomal 30S subunit maturation factor RimM
MSGWTNEADSFSVVDVIRYNAGYLMIVAVSAKGTTFYLPFIAERTLVDATMRGQKLLNKII